MAKVWSEIEIAAAENRCELVLTGQEISQRLDRDGLDCALFTLSKLNYLEISRTSLSLVPDGLYNLSNLSKLSLHSNKLSSVPSSLGRLTLLKHLDLSRNQINSLPEEIDHLVQLHDLNVSSNRLVHLPPIPHLVKLVALDISHNQFDEFPASLLNGGLDHLAEIRARGNVITAIPSRLCRLPSLKTLDIEDNKVQTVAGELGDAAKLKEIFLKGNPLSDRRLLKTVEQCHHKQVIDYIRNHCPRDASEENDGEQSKTKSKKKKNKTGTAAINSDIDMVS